MVKVETEPVPAPAPATLPAEIDCAWWRRHAGLIRCNEAARTFELRPGTPLEDDPDVSAHRENVAQCATSPARLADLVGQDRVMSSLQLAVRAARIREPLGPPLLSGPPRRCPG